MNLPRTFQLSTLAYVLCCVSATANAQATIELGVFTQHRMMLDMNFKPGAPLLKIDIAQSNKWAQVLGSHAHVWADFTDFDSRNVPRPEYVNFFRAHIQGAIQSSPTLNSVNTYRSMRQLILEANSAGTSWRLNSIPAPPTTLAYSFSGPVAAGTQILVKNASTATVTRLDGSRLVVDPSSIGITSKLVVFADYLVNYRVDRSFDRLLGWIDNWTATLSDPLSAIKRTIRMYIKENSKHTNPSEKSLYLKSPASSGSRASIDVKGISVHTASPGVVAYNTILPDSSTIQVPLAFTKNNVGAVLDIAFDGHLLASFNGDGYLTDELNVLEVDISSFAGKSGLMTFTVNTSGPDSAEIFVAEQFSGLGFTTSVVSSVPEPGTAALWFAGLLITVGLWRRRQRSLPT